MTGEQLETNQLLNRQRRALDDGDEIRTGGENLAVRPTRIVCLGGGTGLPAVLKGLARYVGADRSAPITITAVVAVSDDGGSSGRLRRGMDILPPGDIRNCLVALGGKKDLAKVFQHRFESAAGIKGHTVGNLVLAALTEATGDFLEAVRVTGDLLGSKGRVLPSTLRKVNILAALEDGRLVRGEQNLVKAGGKVRRLLLDPLMPPPTPGLLSAIRNADLVVLGPGSLYSSVLPNLLVQGVPGALKESKALKVLVGNLMTQPGETDGFDGLAHLDAVIAHAGKVVDALLINDQLPSADALARYARLGAQPVKYDDDRLLSMGVVPIRRDVLNVRGTRVRHSSRKLADALLPLARASRSHGRVNA